MVISTSGRACPFFQYVSADGAFDTTLGAGVEIGIPVHSSASKNAEFVPKIFDDVKLGDHFTLQAVLGYSTLYGPGDESNTQNLEYGFTVGWTFRHQDLPLPGVQQLIPVFELSGEKQVNKDDAGANDILGNIGFRANLRAIGRVQPRFGAGCIFPLNHVAHDKVHGGVVVSLVFEY